MYKTDGTTNTVQCLQRRSQQQTGERAGWLLILKQPMALSGFVLHTQVPQLPWMYSCPACILVQNAQ